MSVWLIRKANASTAGARRWNGDGLLDFSFAVIKSGLRHAFAFALLDRGAKMGRPFCGQQQAARQILRFT